MLSLGWIRRRGGFLSKTTKSTSTSQDLESSCLNWRLKCKRWFTGPAGCRAAPRQHEVTATTYESVKSTWPPLRLHDVVFEKEVWSIYLSIYHCKMLYACLSLCVCLGVTLSLETQTRSLGRDKRTRGSIRRLFLFQMLSLRRDFLSRRTDDLIHSTTHTYWCTAWTLADVSSANAKSCWIFRLTPSTLACSRTYGMHGSSCGNLNPYNCEKKESLWKATPELRSSSVSAKLTCKKEKLLLSERWECSCYSACSYPKFIGYWQHQSDGEGQGRPYQVSSEDNLKANRSKHGGRGSFISRTCSLNLTGAS